MEQNELIDMLLFEMRKNSGTPLRIKRFIAGKFGNDFERDNYTLIQDAQSELLAKEIIKPSGEGGSYALTTKGFEVAAIGNYQTWLQQQGEKSEREQVIGDLSYRKLQHDAKNAEWISKTYKWTFGMSIAALIISFTLLAIKIIEAFY